MCKCVIGILLADFITLSLLYTSFIELNIHDDHYNIIKLFQKEYEFEGKEDAKVTVLSFLIALVVHTLALIIKWIYQLICCCDCCCAISRNHEDIIYY